MNNEARIQNSRALAKLLRFDRNYPFKIGGWREVSDVLVRLNISFEELTDIVENDPKNLDNNDKGRFELSEDKLYIRARDGHASWIPLDPKIPADNYPDILYHGTTVKSIDSILKIGINKMDRAYVHLSENKIEARRVGVRHRDHVILCVDSQKLVDLGHCIYPPESVAWLTDEVPSVAIKDYAFVGQTLFNYESYLEIQDFLNYFNASDEQKKEN